MSASTPSHGQSGFMSVESIGNALFYLIMIGIAALVVSIVMNTGKGGGDLAAISMVRSNVQYVGANGGSYTGVGGLILSDIVPLLSISGSNYILPSGHRIALNPVGTGAPQFDIVVTNVLGGSNPIDRDLCRKYAYFGIGSKYFSTTVFKGSNVPINKSTMITNAEDGCGDPLNPPQRVILVSN